MTLDVSFADQYLQRNDEPRAKLIDNEEYPTNTEVKQCDILKNTTKFDSLVHSACGEA